MKKTDKLIDNIIAKEARDEARKIVSKMLPCDKKDFIMACEKDSGNIACLILDDAKNKLVKQRLMKNEGYFGTKKDQL